MHYDLAKRNRLKEKFNFKLRDWKLELDEIEGYPRVPTKKGRPGKQSAEYAGRRPEHSEKH